MLNTYQGMEVQLQAFLTSALCGGEWSTSYSFTLSPGERTPITHCMSWLNPELAWTLWRREKSVPLPEIEPSFLGCPTHYTECAIPFLPKQLIQMYSAYIFCCHWYYMPLYQKYSNIFQRYVAISKVHTATITMVEITKLCQLIQELQYEQK
jgi:hypothetical protein